MKAILNPLLSLTILLLFLVSCNDTAETRGDCVEHLVSACNEDPTGVNVRIRNDTGMDICNLVLNWGEYNLGALAQGEETCYYFQDLAYRYPSHYEFYIDDELWGAEAIDFTGETSLDPGKYTYEIYVTDLDNKYNDIRFFED